MTSTESILKRLAEVEAEKKLLQVQLMSVRKIEGQGESRRQKASTLDSSDVESPVAVHDKVTEWLNGPTKQASSSSLLYIFTQHERHHLIFDNVYQRLDIKDIIAISRTCKKLSSFYRKLLPCRWNINRRLARFVNDPRDLRSKLGCADALISGTFALLFFAQLYWLDSGLDIYVRQGSKADALIRYIGEDKSYKFDHSYGWSDDDQHRTLTKVIIFRRVNPAGSPQIRFHLTRTSPLHSILTECAFSTAHVNVITWNKAYCMFPNVTFMDRRMYLLHNPDKAMGNILSKYSAHGWRTSDWVGFDQTKGCNKAGIRERLRRIGDASTWVIPLNTHKIRTPQCPDSVLESCTFQISPDSEPQASRYAVTGLKTFGIDAQTFSCCMLKHVYTFHAPDISWIMFLRERLSHLIKLELLKTGDIALITTTIQPDFESGDPTRCPLLGNLRTGFKRPDGWECVDHMLPAWLEEWRSATRDNKESISLTPQPLTIARSEKQSRTSQTESVEPAPPLVPLSRVRCVTTSKLPSRPKPAPFLSSKGDEYSLSSRMTSPSSASSLRARTPRSISVNHLGPPATIPTKLSISLSPTRTTASVQSEPGTLLPQIPFTSSFFSDSRPALSSISSNPHFHKSHITRSATSIHLGDVEVTSQDIKPTKSPEKRKANYFTLVQRRPNVSEPSPLNISTAESSPLVPDLLTPPSDVTLRSAGHRYKRLPVYFSSHQPWSRVEEKSRNMDGECDSRSATSAAFEKMVPGEMNWI